MRRAVLPLLIALSAMAASAAPPRIAFWRTVPAAHDLGNGETAIVAANGPSEQIDLFLARFVSEANRGPDRAIRDVAERSSAATRVTSVGARARHHAARTYLGVGLTCTETTREGESSSHNADGNRYWRKLRWVEAACTAAIDVFSADTLQRVDSFNVRGEGTSSRQEEVDPAMRRAAVDSALRYAAHAAAEAVTPRPVRERVVLDDRAPAFAEAMAMIETSRPDRARAIWEKALRGGAKSAALRFDLGAVCEALGDVKAAREHYAAAVALQPDERRYEVELEAFRRRYGAKR